MVMARLREWTWAGRSVVPGGARVVRLWDGDLHVLGVAGELVAVAVGRGCGRATPPRAGGKQPRGIPGRPSRQCTPQPGTGRDAGHRNVPRPFVRGTFPMAAAACQGPT